MPEFSLKYQINDEEFVLFGNSMKKLMDRAKQHIDDRCLNLFNRWENAKNFCFYGYRGQTQIFMYGTPNGACGVWSYNESDELRDWCRRRAWFYLGEQWI